MRRADEIERLLTASECRELFSSTGSALLKGIVGEGGVFCLATLRFCAL